MAEFVLILPVAALLLCGTVQFALIAINAVLVQYSAYAVARSAVSYVEPWKSSLTAQKANYTSKRLLDDLNNLHVKADEVVRFIVPAAPADTSLKVENVLFANSDFIHKKITFNYNMELQIPFANRFFAMINGTASNGKYYFPLKGSAIMNSGVMK